MTNRNALKCTLGVVVAALLLAVTWSTTAARFSAWTTNSAVKLNAPAAAPKTLMALHPLMQSAATVATDKSDYHPGETVTVTGSGWAAGETVTLSFAETPNLDGPHVLTTVASDQGNINDNHFAVDSVDSGIAFTLTATGGSSNQTATTTFTDSADGTGVVTLVAVGGSCLAFTPAQGSGPDQWEVVQGGTYTMTITGVTECTQNTITVFIQNTTTGNFCFNATGGPGTYSGTLIMPANGCNTYPISYKCGASQPCNNANTFNANGSSNTHKVHLRANTFGPNCTNPVPDTDCTGGPQGCTCTPPADVTIECGASTDPSNTGGSATCGTGCHLADPPYTDVYAGGNCDSGGHVFQTLTRTWHCTDGTNPPSDCPQKITITDTTPPTITTCPQGGSLGCNPTSTPSCDTVKAQVVAGDTCSQVTLNCQAEDSDTGCTHTRKFTITAKDACSNTSAPCVVTYTWTIDTTPPVITTPGNLTANGAGACCANVTYTASASDNCHVASFSCSPASGSCFPVGTTTVTCGAMDDCGNPASATFTVTVLGQICATKFYDANGNGVQDNGEPGIPGWKIVLDGHTATPGYTGANGTVCFNVAVGPHTVVEVLPPGNWVSSTGTSCTKTIDADHCSASCTFGNYCRLTPGGLTIGFWSNKNGQALETAADFTGLTNFCLRNADGSDRDFTSTLAQNKKDYNSWVLSANASNMANMLSAQLSATYLNVQHGVTNPSVFVDGTRTVADEITYANSLLCGASPCVGYNGNSTAAGPCRTEQERVKNILDKINNGGSFVQPTPCPFTTPY